MPDITFHCIRCGGQLIVDSSGTGKSVACPHCNHQIIIPLEEIKSAVIPDLPPTSQSSSNVNKGKSRRRLKYSVVIAITLLAIIASIVYMVLLFVQYSNEQQYTSIINEINPHGWGPIKWHMLPAKVEKTIGAPLVLIHDYPSEMTYLAKVHIKGKEQVVHCVFSRNDKNSLIRIEILADAVEPTRGNTWKTSEQCKATYDILKRMLTDKLGKPNYFTDNNCEPNARDILRGNCWEKIPPCSVVLIQTFNMTSIMLENSADWYSYSSIETHDGTLAVRTDITDSDSAGKLFVLELKPTYLSRVLSETKYLKNKQKRLSYNDSRVKPILEEEQLDLPLLREVLNYGCSDFHWSMPEESFNDKLGRLFSFIREPSLEPPVLENVILRQANKRITVLGREVQLNVKLDGQSGRTISLELCYPPEVGEHMSDNHYKALLKRLIDEYGDNYEKGEEAAILLPAPAIIWKRGNTRVALIGNTQCFSLRYADTRKQ